LREEGYETHLGFSSPFSGLLDSIAISPILSCANLTVNQSVRLSTGLCSRVAIEKERTRTHWQIWVGIADEERQEIVRVGSKIVCGMRSSRMVILFLGLRSTVGEFGNSDIVRAAMRTHSEFEEVCLICDR